MTCDSGTTNCTYSFLVLQMTHSVNPSFQDVGYGSVRSRASEASDNSRNLESIDWGSPQKGDTSEIRIPVPEKVG